MAAAQRGDANAYRRLLRELALWLRRYYARRLPPSMTEDAVQDVLLAIHEKRHTYDPARCLRAMAFRHRALQMDRPAAVAQGRKHRNRSMTRWVSQTMRDSVVAGSTFQQLLAEPKPAQAEAIRLVKLEGYSVEETSQATGQSVLARQGQYSPRPQASRQYRQGDPPCGLTPSSIASARTSGRSGHGARCGTRCCCLGWASWR